MRTTFIIGILCVLAGTASQALGQACDYPLFLQQSGVDANVMFLFDSSGSMNEAMQHDDYDPSRNYSGSFNRTREYQVANDGTYSPRSFISGASRTPTAKLVDSDAGEDGIYIGNYLNWVFFHANSTQRAAIPQLTRVQMAKAAVNAVISSADARVRFGAFKFYGTEGNGGELVSEMGTNRATIVTQINGIHAQGYTPLAETLVEIMEYYEDSAVGIQYECQRNFVVIVTDGLPTRDSPSGYSDTDGDGYYLDEIATILKNADLRDDMSGRQYANTYCIGMNIDAPILQETATNGDGSYFSANNAATLAVSLQQVLRDIVNRISAGSSVAVVSTEGDGEDYLFRGKFLPSTWYGYLEAFELPYVSGEEAAWEAGSLLASRSPGSRVIFTSQAGSRVDFSSGSASALRAAMGAANNTEADNIIRWVRGEAIAGYRDRRGWILGDIVDSSPVAVGAPGSFYRFNNYAQFAQAHDDRDRVIYVGANDGMLHCFLAETGEELWAYVPNDMLSELKGLSSVNYCHTFTVNLTPRVADCYINGAWRTILIGGLKQGGRAYFAIDVTDPTDPVFMWENDITDVVESWSQPEIVRLRSNDAFVGFVGSGLSLTGEARLVGFNLATGARVHTELLSDNNATNMATGCSVIDLDFDDYDDLMYVADLAGNVHRIDLREDSPESSVLFRTGGLPIQAQPMVTVDFDGDVYVYFGTGRYVGQDDLEDMTDQRFYCVIDRHDGSTVSAGDLVDQTSAINEVEDARGWYIDLENYDGERVTEPSAIVAGIVYFTSFAPANEVCTAGGRSWLYAVQFRNGAAYDGDDHSGNDSANNRSSEIGEGIASKPVVDVINGKVLVQGSDTRIHIEDTRGQIRQLVVRSWQQRY